MYSDPSPQDPPQEGQQVPEQAYAGVPRVSPWRKAATIAAVVSAGAFAVYVVWRVVGPDALAGILAEYWPVLLSPIVGALIARFAVRMLYRPSGRVLVHLDAESHLLRAVFVPEEMFRYLTQTGNNVVYHTASGIPVYLVEDMDLDRGVVDYGWIHTENALVVMTRESAYRRWYRTLNTVLEENLELMVHPKVIGLGYARGALKKHLDGISSALGITEADYDPHDPSGPIPEDYLDLTEHRRDERGDGRGGDARDGQQGD